jgi:hypothetical protein
MITRHLFEILTDTGIAGLAIKGDTGFFTGEIVQIAVSSNRAGDSGVFEIAFMPGGKSPLTQAQLDTGINGFFIASGSYTGATLVRRVPRQPLNALSTAGTDTGGAPVYGRNDKLRLKIRSGGIATAGVQTITQVWVWVKD